jgi:hypothetical protein
MSGVFDRLQKKLDLVKKDEGISPLELASLPPNLRKIMRIMAREVQIFYPDLIHKMEGLPERERLSPPELKQALQELSRAGWLIERGEGDRLNYQVNFRRKAGSKIAQGIWGSLDAKIAANKAARQASKERDQ